MSWWDPLTWWKPIDKQWRRVSGDVKNLIRHAVHTAVNAVEADISDLSNWTGGAINGLSNWLSGVANVAGAAWNWAWHIANVDLPNWAGDVRGWVMDVLGPIYGALSWAENWINQAWGEIESLINSAWRGFYRDVISPIEGWINEAAGFVWHIIDDAWQGFYRDVIHPIEAGLSDAWAIIWHLWDWFDHVARDAIEGVIKAWDWIVFFGEHPGAELADLAHIAEHALSPHQVFTAAQRSAQTSGGEIEAIVERVLGEL